MKTLIKLTCKEEGYGSMLVNADTISYFRTVKGKITAFGREKNSGEVHFTTAQTLNIYETAEEIESKMREAGHV